MDDVTQVDIIQLRHLAETAKLDNRRYCNPVLSAEKLLELCDAWEADQDA